MNMDIQERPLEHCFDEGRAAALDGSDERACPYSAETIEYETWMEGYESVVEDN
jgi:ribosome modulation factor